MFYFDSKFCNFLFREQFELFESLQLLPKRGGAGRCLAPVCTSRVVGGSGLVGLVGPSGPLSKPDTSRSSDRRRKQFTTESGFYWEGTGVADRMVQAGFDESTR